MVKVDNDILLTIANNHEKATFLLLNAISNEGGDARIDRLLHHVGLRLARRCYARLSQMLWKLRLLNCASRMVVFAAVVNQLEDEILKYWCKVGVVNQGERLGFDVLKREAFDLSSRKLFWADLRFSTDRRYR